MKNPNRIFIVFSNGVVCVPNDPSEAESGIAKYKTMHPGVTAESFTDPERALGRMRELHQDRTTPSIGR
jgi:hypothetical protein